MTLPPYPCLNVPPDGNCPYTPTYQARECVSGAAWWASQYTGKPWPTGWGDAYLWPDEARAAGFDVDGNCTENSVMCLPPNHNGAGLMGHVAYVVGPTVQSHAVVWEMDFLVRFGFDYRPALVTGCEYIHLTPKPGPPSPTGDPDVPPMYQRTNGSTYLLVGASLLTLGTPADIEYNLSLGSKIILESKITPAYAASFNKLPVIA